MSSDKVMAALRITSMTLILAGIAVSLYLEIRALRRRT